MPDHDLNEARSPGRWAAIVNVFDAPSREALTAEVDEILSGRIRAIRLGGRLKRSYDETSWRQRSRVSRAWLISSMILSSAMIVLDCLADPRLFYPTMILRAGVMVTAYLLLAAVWLRPRADWVEGLTLPVAVAVMLGVGGVQGLIAGDEMANRYLTAGLLAASTAIVIFPVAVAWSLTATMAAVALYLGFALMDPLTSTRLAILFSLFFSVVLIAMAQARHTINILQQHAFIQNFRSALQTQALAEANARLAVLAHTDALTGLPNRRAYEEEARRLWTDPFETSRNLGVVLFDIDHFKRLNDTAGHAVGDQCLSGIAGAISRIVPEGGLCARYGGEEFICILRETTPRGLLRFAEDIRASVEAMSWPNPGTGRSVTVSVGVAVGMPDRRLESLAALIGAADGALYRAKAEGRNRIAAPWDAPVDGIGARSYTSQVRCA